MNERIKNEIRGLLLSGRKIEAIKRYSDETGAGLVDAKDAVESLELGNSFPEHSQPDDSELTRQVIRLLGRGEKIEAVKLYRTRFGGGLKEAKEAVERIGEENGIPSSSGSGCLSLILLAAIIVAGLSL